MNTEIEKWLQNAHSSGMPDEEIYSALKAQNYTDDAITSLIGSSSHRRKTRRSTIVVTVAVAIGIVGAVTYLTLVGFFVHKVEKNEEIVNAQITNIVASDVRINNLVRNDAVVIAMKNMGTNLETYKQSHGQYPESLTEVNISYTPSGYQSSLTLHAEDFSYTTKSSRKEYSICATIGKEPLFGSKKSYQATTQTYCYDGVKYFTPDGESFMQQYIDRIYIADEVRRNAKNELVKPLHIVVKNSPPNTTITYQNYQGSYKEGQFTGSQIEIKEDQPVVPGDNIFWIKTTNVPSWKYLIYIYSFNDELVTQLGYDAETLDSSAVMNVPKL